jgi:hypothetical protein
MHVKKGGGQLKGLLLIVFLKDALLFYSKDSECFALLEI